MGTGGEAAKEDPEGGGGSPAERSPAACVVNLIRANGTQPAPMGFTGGKAINASLPSIDTPHGTFPPPTIPDGASVMKAVSARRRAHAEDPELPGIPPAWLIGLAKNPAADERVRSVCAVAVLDRGGVMPIDKPEAEPDQRQKFDPRAYTPEDLAVIEAGLKLMQAGRSEGMAPEPEVIPPGDR